MEDNGAAPSAPPADNASQPAAPVAETPASSSPANTPIDHGYFGIADDGEGLDLTKTSEQRRAELEERITRRAEEHPEFKGEKSKPKSPTATPPPAGAPAEKQPKAEREVEADDPEKPFKFGGGQFKDQAAAEHSFRTLRGTFRSTLEKLNQAAQARNNASVVAQSWKDRADKLEQELNQLKAGAPAAAPQGGKAGAQPPAPVGGIDLSVLPAIMADPELGQTGALVYLVDQLSKNAEANNAKLLETFESRLKERIAPLEAPALQSRAAEAADQLVTSMATWVWPAGHPQAGQPAYPELLSEATQEAIGRLHIDSGRDPALLLTQAGLEDAIARYRFFHGAPAATPAPQPTPTPARQPSSADTAAALSSPAAPAVRPVAGNLSEAGRIKQGLRRAPSHHEYFGVAP